VVDKSSFMSLSDRFKDSLSEASKVKGRVGANRFRWATRFVGLRRSLAKQS